MRQTRETFTRLWQAAPDLVVVMALALLALAAGVLWSESAVSALLGALLVLVLPGYAVFAALTAGREQGGPSFAREPAEIALFALVLTTAAVVVGSLLLNILPWGMTAGSWRAFLALLSIGLGAYAVMMRLRNPTPIARPQLPNIFDTPSATRDVLLLAFAMIVIGLALGLGGVGAAARPRAPFTQLWATPRADGSTVEVGIRNEEGRPVTYRLIATTGDILLADEANIRLDEGEDRRFQLPLAIQGAPAGIDILLYRDDAPHRVYRSVRIEPPWEAG